MALAVPVSHVVPTYGYLLGDDRRLRRLLGRHRPDRGAVEGGAGARGPEGDLRRVLLPERDAEIADVSKHLTPATLRRRCGSSRAGVPVNLYHMKPPTLPQLRADVAALGNGRVSLLADGDELTF